MPSLPPPSPAAEATGRQHVWLAGLALGLATAAAYVTSFQGAMVFDDLYAIVANPTIRDLGQPGAVLFPPGDIGGTIGGRPVVNLTLALNYAISGLDPWSYHAVNLGIHLLAGLALFGLVRRTVLRSAAAAPCRDTALLLALAVASLWALHPLQTESVTYLVQRAESLMGLCYLLTLYCFVRSVESPHPRRWQAAAFAACLAGMGCKEVMVTAPLLVLGYDRIFVAGSWREAWRLRRGLHVALPATWLLLAVLVAGTANRGGTAGFGTAVAWWEYALTQCAALPHYLRLALWPHPLVFDYGTPLVRSFAPVALPAALLLLLLGATGWALARKPALGFLGAAFFLLLAPSSSVVPVATQTMAEHRMYLPLAAVLTLLALGASALAGRRALVALLALAAVAGGLTARRNLDYRSELTLWTDTVAHRPENPRARTNLGIALVEAGRLPEAVAQFEESLHLQPETAATELNLCLALTRLNRAAEAVPHGEAAVRLDPRSADARLNLALALDRLGRPAEAVVHYESARRLEPGAPDVAAPLAADLVELGNRAAAREDFGAAIDRYRQALAVVPDHAQARNNLANALLVTGQLDEAITQYREALQRNPGDRLVRENLERALEIRRSQRR
jgi:tetratricopeptide (TPR) repeat protein